MSNIALDLLIEAGLLTSSGKAMDISKFSDQEISEKFSHYNMARISAVDTEIKKHPSNNKLNALFSSSSTSTSHESILSSCLVYDSIILNDPLVTSANDVNMNYIKRGLEFFEWAFELIRSQFLLILPLSFFNKPSSEIPLLHSDDAFRSSIPKEIHDFIHSNKSVKSVIRGEEGSMLVLKEDASISRRMALNVGFKDDYWRNGVSLYLFQTVENYRKDEHGHIVMEQAWDPGGVLDKEKFEHWQYQAVNQAMRARLKNIYNETYLANILGHTYVTESSFEAKFLSMSGDRLAEIKHPSARFLDANQGFIFIDKPETIVKLRDKYSSGFERFNYSLQAISAELSNVAPEDFDFKAKQLFHSQIMPQIDEMRNNVGSLSRAAIKGSLSMLGGFSAAILTGSSVPLIPGLLLTATSAMTEAFPFISNSQSMKNKPAFIWHSIAKK